MNGNTISKQHNEVRYCYGNLPPSAKVAVSRLDRIDEDIAKIEGDLQAKTERALGTPDAYDDWKIKASRAAAHLRREKSFILNWLSYENGCLERNKDIISEQDRRDRLHGMVTEFLKSAPPYGISISENEQLTSEMITGRRAELSELKLEYGAFLTFLKGESFRINCPLDYYHSARGRVARVVHKAEAEILHLKKLSKTFLSETQCPNGVKSYHPDPQASADSRLSQINLSIHQIKAKIDMNSSGMTSWLYDIVADKKHLLNLTPDQIRMFELIDEYIKLTQLRISIEFKG